MSRPFDDTKEWWREELRELAPIVHQLHPEGGKTWKTCNYASCSRIRAIIDESHRDTGTQILSIDEIVSVRIRRK